MSRSNRSRRTSADRSNHPMRWFFVFMAGMVAGLSFLALPPGFASASEGVPAANCVFDVGDGSNGDDANVDHIYYPGQQYTIGGGNDSWFVNCNARNFKVNDGTEWNVDGTQIGDRYKTLEATTPSGVKFRISMDMYWTLNQNRESMLEFWSICLKYQCASGSAFDPNAENFSTPGWNGFLAENVAYALWSSARIAAESVNDGIWDLESNEQYNLLAAKISENFNNELRYTLGFQNDIICGSSTSQWQDPNNPGADGNVFNCTNVRVKITDITLAPDADQGPTGLAIINQARYNTAEILYGENTHEVLGDLDQLEVCAQAGASCTVIFGDPANQGVMTEPSASPTPVP